MTSASTVPPLAPRRVDPVAAAAAFLARFDVRAPHEIAIELMAYRAGAVVLWRNTGSADARVVRAGGRAYFAIDKSARGTPRARYSVAHETGHHDMHPDHDAVARLHGLPASDREHALERDANVFASHVLVPSSLAAGLCARATPTLDAVLGLARTFDVSLTVAARRWAALAGTPCAFVESRRGKIKRVVRSGAFRGIAVERRVLEEGTLTYAMGRDGGERGARAYDEGAQRWGSALLDAPVHEECVPLGDGGPGGAVLTWLWHE